MEKKYIQAKLKSLDEVKKISNHTSKSDLNLYHSSKLKYIHLYSGSLINFGNIILVYLIHKKNNRSIYIDDNFQWYYDEWFEWIGKPKEFIPKELWEI